MRMMLLAATVLATASPVGAAPVEIRYSSFGVAHVRADTMEGAGYGYGYAFARDNLCIAVDHAITLAGERSQRLGPDATYFDGFASLEAGAQVPNALSDAFYRATLTPAKIARAKAHASEDVRALMRGFARGFSAHANGAALPGENCRGAPGYRAMTEDDMWRRALHIAFLETSNLVLLDIAKATPPGSGPAKPQARFLAGDAADTRAGSNAAAFGRTMTGGGGLSFSNPHFPWSGIERLHAVHLTVPGKLDVMGGALYNFPLPMLGFNRSFGWSITYTTDQHSTFYRLDLDPNDPTRYRLDGRWERMERVVVPVPLAKGSREQILWRTKIGFVAATPEAPWTREHAFVFADPELDNDRIPDQFLSIARATTVGEAKAAMDRHMALPWSNLTGADAKGDVLYANISLTADVDDALLKRCAIPTRPDGKPWAIWPIAAVLDGSKSQCAWRRDPAAVQPGTVPPARRPSTIRDDFVLNSNDSHWLASWDDARLSGFAATIGPEATARGERTRMGIIMARGRRDGSDGLGAPGIDVGRWEALFFRSRNLMAELILDDVLTDCRRDPSVSVAGEMVDLTAACVVLGRWDRSNRLEQPAVILFREFLQGLERTAQTGFVLAPRYWKTPFDPRDPAATPSGFVPSAETRAALAKAVLRMRKANLDIDAPLGSMQVAHRGDARLPMSGSRYSYNLIGNRFAADGKSLESIVGGNSYMHIVELTPEGPKGRFMITYSQSTNAASPHFGDWTAHYSTQRLSDVAFSEAEVRAAQVGPTLTLSPEK